ncbi:MAG: penicillin acylase family protein [Cytophagales bacterium]|nr:penicillin acylase family protein [Cytophagales bacterium]
MKIIRVILFTIIVIAIVISAIVTSVRAVMSPDYRGELAIGGLSAPVEVYYTDHGIPHIYAETEIDAYRALGYVHAQDRLWQMDLLRRVGGGRLAEIFGESLVETDQYFRTIGTHEYARTSAEDLRLRGGKMLAIAEAYVAGVNHFMNTGPKTVEHTLLGMDMEPYTVENIYEVLTYMSFSFANAQKLDPLLTELYTRLDSTYIEDIPVFSRPNEYRMSVTNGGQSSALSAHTNKVLNELNVPLFIGSNSWVIGPKLSASGNTILANDPHIGFAQPSVWYEAHLSHPEGEVYGYFIAGDPIPPIMHNTQIATGLTMFENDDIDFYLEKINPDDDSQYMYKGEWEPFAYASETIRVKDGDPVKFTKRKTKHGPVLSDVMEEEDQTVSMFWVYTAEENFSMEASYEINAAKNATEAASGASKIHGPGLNVMFGSSKGEYARWSSGRLIYRENEQDSKTYRDGSSGLHDPDSVRPFSQNPIDLNAKRGYTYSANNHPEPVDGVYYSGYYLPDDRGESIVGILESEELWSVEEVKQMMLDHHAVMMPKVKSTLLNAVNGHADEHVHFILGEWTGSFERESKQAPFFQLWVYETLRQAMIDEMDSTLWDNFRGTHLFKRTFEPLIQNRNSVWWDDVRTDKRETRDDIIKRAYDLSWDRFTPVYGEDPEAWRWENHHMLTHKHAMSSASAALAKFLDVGPFMVPGTNEVINNLGFTYSDALIHQVSFGPSTRRIVDMADPINNSWSILPTGQSGNPFSPYYDDQAAMYANGEYRKMLLDPKVIKQSKLLLKLTVE